jgi:hypothetical protein
VYAGKVETIVFDKDSNTVMVTRTRITCQKKLTCHSLDSIAKITANRRGSKSKSLNTEHFVLMIYFKERAAAPAESGEYRQKKFFTPPLKILSTKNDVRIRKELLLLRKFLNLDMDQPIRIIDNTDGLIDGKPEKLSLDKVIKKASKEV